MNPKDKPRIDPRRRQEPLNRQERPKFALQNTGGQTVVAGDPKVSAALAHALATEDEERDRLTHGFHSYPARMHWVTAERVLEALDIAGARVLDPFCGSGTVLVEARVRGLEAMGVDLNPLAVRLARVKCDPLDKPLRDKLESLGGELREASEERVRARENVRADLPPTELKWYEPHVLKEMAGLLDLIGTVDDPKLREVLTMVFSSLVVKFSRQRSDTSEEVYERRIRKGLVSEFFERKVLELCDRLRDLEQGSEPGPAPHIVEGDAHWLREIVERGAIDLIFTSPPYGGTYDYASHHARRFAWLGIQPAEFTAKEIGARRKQLSPDSFAKELHLALRSMRSTLSRDGWMVLLMGDGQHGNQRVPADKLVEELAEDAGLEPIAIASQERPDFQGREPRYEHLMALRAK
ncbi:MAG: putative modification methylase [Myxococcaceae bacterium]|nr:putative modification methylase [Myxococcaceae bacterium]